jgi:hypothetical protein
MWQILKNTKHYNNKKWLKYGLTMKKITKLTSLRTKRLADWDPGLPDHTMLTKFQTLERSFKK